MKLEMGFFSLPFQNLFNSSIRYYIKYFRINDFILLLNLKDYFYTHLIVYKTVA